MGLIGGGRPLGANQRAGVVLAVVALVSVGGLLITAAIGLVPIVLAPPKLAVCPRASVTPTAATWSRDRAAVLCLINNQRALSRVAPVREVYTLEHGANLFVARMVKYHFFSHTDPIVRRSFDQRFVATGYPAGADIYEGGENLAWGAGNTGSPESIVKAWSDSRLGHRDIMLSSRYLNIGVSIAPQSPWGGYGGTFVVDFGYRSPPLR